MVKIEGNGSGQDFYVKMVNEKIKKSREENCMIWIRTYDLILYRYRRRSRELFQDSQPVVLALAETCINITQLQGVYHFLDWCERGQRCEISVNKKR